MKLLLFICVLAPAVCAQVERCSALDRHGERSEATACYQQLLRGGDSLARAQSLLALHEYKLAVAQFDQAEKEHPNSAVVQTSYGRLWLELDRQSEAVKEFQGAMKADSRYAPAYIGLARVLSESYDKTSVQLATEALKQDPQYYPAHELLSYLALEDGNTSLAIEEAQKAISISSDALDGMAVLASIDFLKGNGIELADDSPWMERIRKIDPNYGEAYATAGHFFEINYRYSEAIAAYRKAIDLNPNLSSARSRLGVNLMRLGQTQEAQQQLSNAYYHLFQNPETRNSLRFLDTISQYETFTVPEAEIVLNKKEAALLRPYIEPELRLAMASYEQKYHLKLPGRVRLEVYPNHDDFVVRTLGLPGQGGLLGVTFDTVVAIDSPSARAAGEFSWADTMWHELCHVYVISATHHLVPRWFSEGLAVHEEGVASPEWGNRLTPDTLSAIREKKLLPVLELDAGFVRPQYPNQVLVSYYQAGEICDYIAQRWGDAAILGIIHSYAAHKTTQEAFQDNLHETPQAFDKDFLTWLDKKTANPIAHFDQWKEGMKSAALELHSGNNAAALTKATAIQDFYPDYPATYDLLAMSYASMGKKPEAMQALERYQSAGGNGVNQLKQLAHLQAEFAHPEKAIQTLQEINLIYPEDQEHHQDLGALLLKTNRPKDAVLEYKAVLALNPADVAESHLNLARALSAAHETSEAKDQVLLALEAAPNYKPAQQLLLQLTQ